MNVWLLVSIAVSHVVLFAAGWHARGIRDYFAFLDSWRRR